MTWLLTVALAVGDDARSDRTPRSEYRPHAGSVVRADAALAALVQETVVVEQLATGFTFLEGPVWVGRDGEAHLAFSDLRGNALHRWYLDGRLATLATPFIRSGRSRNMGPNGITIDSEGRLVICDSGHRRIVRLEHDGRHSVLADRYRGRRLNSPNDLVYRSDGSLYFTDPPHGLAGEDRDPDKDLPFSGVYRLRPDGSLGLLVTDLPRPNGIALAPDERTLYISNTHGVVLAYDVHDDGTLGRRSVLRDLTAAGGADGVKVDRMGHVYVATPAGIAILNARGRLLGSIVTDEPPSNLAWGEDGSALYITARTGLYRVRLLVRGVSGAHPLPVFQKVLDSIHKEKTTAQPTRGSR